jgi:positive regulator of sigma E activity
MSKEIRNFLLIYIVPICFISLFFVFFAPAIFAQAVLAMVASVVVIVIAFALIIDYIDNK